MSAAPRLDLPAIPSALVVLQDGRPITAGEVASRSAELAGKLRALKAVRAMLPTDRADHVVIALFACQETGCDLVLHRGPLRSQDIVEAMHADAVIDEALVATEAGESATPRGRLSQVILMTSGTTGLPKAASHALDKLLGLIPDEQPTPPPRWLLTYHPASFAGFQVVLTALRGHAPLAALSSGDAVALCETAKAFAPTAISGTPTFWRAFLLALGGEETKVPLRHATLGGEAVDQGTLDRIHAHFPNARIAHIYASTEAGAVFTVKDGRAGFPAAWLDAAPGGVRLRIAGDILQIASPRRMAGYVSDHRTPLDDQGWLDTGDVVRIEDDRVLFSGRRDSIINVGGQKVRPEEVETLVLGLPGVVDAQVKGIANPITGQLIGVDIVVAPGTDEAALKAAVRGLAKELPAHAVPRIVKIVPELRTTQGGKKSRA